MRPRFTGDETQAGKDDAGKKPFSPPRSTDGERQGSPIQGLP